MTQLEIEAITEFIKSYPKCKIYLGADSQRMKKKKIKYVTALVVHYIGEDGVGNGAKVFTDIKIEDAIKENLARPFVRMMREVQLVTELYMNFEDILLEREVEIHIDVNPDKSAGSNVAYGAAKGMIKGMIGIDPICKPDAWCASTVSDKYTK